MVTPSVGLPRNAPPPAPTKASAVPTTKDATQTQETKAAAQTDTSVSGQRKQQNLQILQASMDVSIQASNTSLTLLYRTAIDRINEFLAPELGPNAIGAADAPDGSPEATAGRILSLSTAFFDAYAAQSKNKDKAPDVMARDFVDLIRGGFERGFGEARDILTGLGVLGEDSPIEQGINKTYALVMKGYDDFLASKLVPPVAPDASAAKSKEAS